MNAALWVVQSLLALAFAAAGGMKLTRTKEQLAARPGMEWTTGVSAAQIKAIGLVEVLGALGVVLPWGTDVLPILTPVAASGLAVVMGGALATHLRRREPATPAIVLGALALLVAVGRFHR